MQLAYSDKMCQTNVKPDSTLESKIFSQIEMLLTRYLTMSLILFKVITLGSRNKKVLSQRQNETVISSQDKLKPVVKRECIFFYHLHNHLYENY